MGAFGEGSDDFRCRLTFHVPFSLRSDEKHHDLFLSHESREKRMVRNFYFLYVYRHVVQFCGFPFRRFHSRLFLIKYSLQRLAILPVAFHVRPRVSSYFINLLYKPYIFYLISCISNLFAYLNDEIYWSVLLIYQ